MWGPNQGHINGEMRGSGVDLGVDTSTFTARDLAKLLGDVEPARFFLTTLDTLKPLNLDFRQFFTIPTLARESSPQEWENRIAELSAMSSRLGTEYKNLPPGQCFDPGRWKQKWGDVYMDLFSINGGYFNGFILNQWLFEAISTGKTGISFSDACQLCRSIRGRQKILHKRRTSHIYINMEMIVHARSLEPTVVGSPNPGIYAGSPAAF